MTWRPKKLTREQMAERRMEGVRLLEKGSQSQAEIARILGVSEAAVCVWAKKLRNHGKDENVAIAPPRVLTIETAMEWIDADELVEVTPDAVRVRKQVLAINKRQRRSDAIEEAQAIDY